MENESVFSLFAAAEPDFKAVALYCDGGVCFDGSHGASNFGGSWAFCAVDANDELLYSDSGFLQVEDRPTSNNHTEMYAAIMALESVPEGWSGTLYSDSKITLGRLFEGWRNKNLPEEYVLRAKNALIRLGKVQGKHLDGHPTKAQLEAGIGKRGNPVSKWNIFCDDLCTQEINKVKGKLK